MEQRSRKPLPGQLAHEEAATVPSPRLPAVDSVPDDEIDSDAPVPAPKAETKVDDRLSEREREILTFERQSWRHAGAKEQAIRDRFELSATRYYQLLNALLDNPAALAHDPVLVGRLRRLRGSRARARGR
ncbi:MAG TPA: DUF3263 domain-containing protein [Candidatus Limnocylindrales bacterium]|nr:DUF3263 domain-containing protein [Candidatus Limnocylindrales bacterium]